MYIHTPNTQTQKKEEYDMRKIHFFIPGEPARVTEQQHRYGGRKKNGQVVVYRDSRLSAARAELMEYLWKEAPKEPIEGPVRIEVCYTFGTKNKRFAGMPKTTKPDTDNLIKGLKDCMTEAGFWLDDAQVYREIIAKFWSVPENAGIEITVYGGDS